MKSLLSLKNKIRGKTESTPEPSFARKPSILDILPMEIMEKIIALVSIPSLFFFLPSSGRLDSNILSRFMFKPVASSSFPLHGCAGCLGRSIYWSSRSRSNTL